MKTRTTMRWRTMSTVGAGNRAGRVGGAVLRGNRPPGTCGPFMVKSDSTTGTIDFHRNERRWTGRFAALPRNEKE